MISGSLEACVAYELSTTRFPAVAGDSARQIRIGIST